MKIVPAEKRLKALKNRLTSTIENAKSKYYYNLSMKLSNSETSSKAYWPILASFVNDKEICDGVVLEIYLDRNFQWPQECVNCGSLAYKVVT